MFVSPLPNPNAINHSRLTKNPVRVFVSVDVVPLIVSTISLSVLLFCFYIFAHQLLHTCCCKLNFTFLFREVQRVIPVPTNCCGLLFYLPIWHCCFYKFDVPRFDPLCLEHTWYYNCRTKNRSVCNHVVTHWIANLKGLSKTPWSKMVKVRLLK